MSDEVVTQDTILAILATLQKQAEALQAASQPRSRTSRKAIVAATPQSEFERVCVAANIRKGNRKEVLRAIIPGGVGVYPFAQIGETANLAKHEVLQAVEYIGNRFAEDTCAAGYVLSIKRDDQGGLHAVLSDKVFAPLAEVVSEPQSTVPAEVVPEPEVVVEQPHRRNRK